MGGTFVILGGSVIALLLAGYLGQIYLPPPKPKIVGIDLGTTYSCIGIYHAVTGNVDILETQEEHKCIPSVVAFSESGVLVGYHAVSQAEHNPNNTIYDTKRFIGKVFSPEELRDVRKQYSFRIELDNLDMARYVVMVNGTEKFYTPQDIGSIIIETLKQAAERNLTSSVTKAVISVPAEFDDLQRNYTRKAAALAGINVIRIINEPTAAALAYGLHKQLGLQNVLVVDLGGGTLDTSLLNVQGGMFLTQAMAGNNHLGGQDFNQRLLHHIQSLIREKYGKEISDKEDLQLLRLHVEEVKLNLTSSEEADINLSFHSLGGALFRKTISRASFEEINMDLFKKVLEPISVILNVLDLLPDGVDEIVLVGGSTRIPKIRQLIRDYFRKDPNVSIDPELAVAMGVSIQAGILGGMWPLSVSAVELPIKVKKIHIH